MPHSKQEIDTFLRSAFFAVLNFQQDNALQSELMVFSHHIDGSFYLTTRKTPDNFDSITHQRQVSLLIYKEEETLTAINYVQVAGTAELITDFDTDVAKEGFERIGEKSPKIRNIVYEEDREKHCLIKVTADSIGFTNIGELRKGEPSTFLESPDS